MLAWALLGASLVANMTLLLVLLRMTRYELTEDDTNDLLSAADVVEWGLRRANLEADHPSYAMARRIREIARR